MGLLGVIACGLTLIGATTYFVATRYVRKRRQNRKQNAEESDEDLDYLHDAEDYRSAAKRSSLRKGATPRPPPLITFAELFEQALNLERQRTSFRTVKIYFDSNDEFVKEEQIPELILSARTTNITQDDIIDEEELIKINETIAFKYRCVNVFFGNEEHAISGTTRITRNIFAGTNGKTENAMLFLDNLQKIK